MKSVGKITKDRIGKEFCYFFSLMHFCKFSKNGGNILRNKRPKEAELVESSCYSKEAFQRSFLCSHLCRATSFLFLSKNFQKCSEATRGHGKVIFGQQDDIAVIPLDISVVP